jgi:hypothetical protein
MRSMKKKIQNEEKNNGLSNRKLLCSMRHNNLSVLFTCTIYLCNAVNTSEGDEHIDLELVFPLFLE